MKNGKRGEVLTLLAVSTLVALAITTITSSVLVNRNKITNQGVQAAQVCSVDKSPETAPAGFKWQPHCSEANKCSGGPEGNKECNIKYPGKVTWCYGFDGPNKNAADFRCMTLDAIAKSPNPSAPANPNPANPTSAAKPTAPASNTCQAHTPPVSGEQPKCSAFTFGKAKIDDYLWNISCNASCNPNNEEASKSECAKLLNKSVNQVWCYGFGDGGKCMSYAGPAGSCSAPKLNPDGSSTGTGGTGVDAPTCQAQIAPSGVQTNCGDFTTKKMKVENYLWDISCNVACPSGGNTEADRSACATALGKSVNQVWCYGFADGAKCMSYAGAANSCVVVPVSSPTPKPTKVPVPTAEPTERIPDPPNVPVSDPDDDVEEGGDTGAPVDSCSGQTPSSCRADHDCKLCGDGVTCLLKTSQCPSRPNDPNPNPKPSPTANPRAVPPTCYPEGREYYLIGDDNKCYHCPVNSNRPAVLSRDQTRCDDQTAPVKKPTSVPTKRPSISPTRNPTRPVSPTVSSARPSVVPSTTSRPSPTPTPRAGVGKIGGDCFKNYGRGVPYCDTGVCDQRSNKCVEMHKKLLIFNTRKENVIIKEICYWRGTSLSCEFIDRQDHVIMKSKSIETRVIDEMCTRAYKTSNYDHVASVEIAYKIEGVTATRRVKKSTLCSNNLEDVQFTFIPADREPL